MFIDVKPARSCPIDNLITKPNPRSFWSDFPYLDDVLGYLYRTVRHCFT